MKYFVSGIFILLSFCTHAQVKIGDNPGTINANSLLELESTDKGMLPPRVTLSNLTSVSPLSGTVPAGMLVYNEGGNLVDGYYYWNGNAWLIIAKGQSGPVFKSVNATLGKQETFVLASNDITLTLPAITNDDDGLSITIKNVGTHKNLIHVRGNSGALLDNLDHISLPRWFSITMTANAGNWSFKERTVIPANTMEVSPYSSWTTIGEALEFLGVHMDGPVVIRLTDANYEINNTIDIDLPYSLTIQGSSSSTSTLVAATGLEGKPMFRCISDSYFKMLAFDATTLTDYGTQTGEDAIRLVGIDTYHEVKDCSFNRFYNTVLDSTNAEFRLFETDILNAVNNAILIHGAVPGVTVKVAETDFIHCKRGINLDKASSANIQVSSGGFKNLNSTDTAIVYRPATFIAVSNMSIKGNEWNHTGKYIEGFDFTRADGRDANAIVESNVGMGDQTPKCNIHVSNSSTSTTLATLNTWYKADWGNNSSSQTCKWTIDNNKITYQPVDKRNAFIIISGNVSANADAQNITVGLVKNGVMSTPFGSTTIRTVTGDQPFPFSMNVYLPDVTGNDFFELYVNNETSSGKTVKFHDIQWLVNAQ